MRVLLDECLPRRLKRHLSSHEVATVPEMGWAGRKDRELLALAEPLFDAFISVDRGIAYQQNLSGIAIRIVLLSATSNRLEALLPLVPSVLVVLSGDSAEPVVRLTAPPP